MSFGRAKTNTEENDRPLGLSAYQTNMCLEFPDVFFDSHLAALE